MAVKTIYLTRHGQTDFNKEGIAQGSGVDTSLNSTGIDQSKRFFKMYGLVDFEKIYCSKLKRSKESIILFNQKFKIPIYETEALNEINWGNEDGQTINLHNSSQYLNMVKRWAEGEIEVCLEGGESPYEVALRQQPFLDNLFFSQEETVLICMHGRAMRILLCQLTGAPLAEMDTFLHENMCLYILQYDIENNNYRITLRNSTKHLK